MRCFLALLALFVLYISRPAQAAGAGLSYREDEEFLRWRAEFYDSEDENDLARIYPTWRENADYVQKQNSLGLSYTLALNKFAHLSRAQFAKRVLQPTYSSTKVTSSLSAGRDPPSSVDWRKKGVVPPVRNQGQCGDAIAYATVGAIDSFHAIKTGNLVLGSEEEVLDCCLNCQCDGGLLDSIYPCIVKIGGLASEDEYHSPDCKCLNNTFKPQIKIHGGKDVLPARNETALAYAVAMQPVAAAIDAGQPSFQFYQSGIYDDPNCSSTELDHVILIVGYGSEDGQDYWICQNSWGTSWGMEGYILMSRNKGNQCGIATDASYPY